MISLKLKVKGLDKVLKNYSNFHKENPRILAQSMNKASRVARTAALLKTRKHWSLKAKDLRNKTKLIPANVGRSEVTFKMHSTPINLFEFGAKELKGIGGVSYKIQKKRNKLRGNYFIAGGGRNTYVFHRRSKDRTDIMPYFSITPSFMFTTEKADNEYIRTFYRGKGGQRGFKKEYLSQLTSLLTKKP